MENFCKIFSPLLKKNYQYTFCQIQRESPHAPLAFRSVCALKEKSGVHTQPWLCKQETNRVAQVEPPTQDIKYQHFSRVSTKRFGIVCHNLCCTQDKLMLCVTHARFREH